MNDTQKIAEIKKEFEMKRFRVDWEAIINAPTKGIRGGFSFIKAKDEKEAEKKFRKNVFKGELVSFTFVKLEIKEENAVECFTF